MHPHVARLLSLPQYAQLSDEWFAIRKTLVTASIGAAALGIPPYSSFAGCPREASIRQTVEGTFKGSVATRHGQKYEDHVRDIFSGIMGKRVYELGLIRHIDVHGPETGLDWLGVSADGITEHNELVEIKAPYRRTIIPGECPHHYWPQCQLQMECIDVNVCYFIEWQPEWLSSSGREVINIVPVERDREWFRRNKEVFHQYFLDLQHRRATYVRPPPRACLVRDALYDDLETGFPQSTAMFVDE
jgi:putative phage-type endonuclease